ncbi:hypothetical protein [Aromatoleum anaerobium]|uniref:Uncharacterized protein n=1 Tax=Aromatoleum anaerobium TaxID=182180 RepID=A0ABX1PRS0_9RHOO|nr:hypothetical protein [Aromatoleum anaerobium]MCK0508645.1 hypothetical protein [Aromatoleum anaerobium]
METDWMMRRLRSIGLALLLPVALGTTSARADVLDGIVFGMKCLGAADRQACEERSKREADETRDRLRERPAPNTQPVPIAEKNKEETFGQRIHRNWVKNLVCYNFAKRSVRDVDSTYARATARYGFMNPAELSRQTMTVEAGINLAGYLHETIPGARYRLEQVVHSQDVASGKRQYKLNLELARDGSGTRVSGHYCVTTDDPAGWQDLSPQVLSSLNSTF